MKKNCDLTTTLKKLLLVPTLLFIMSSWASSEALKNNENTSLIGDTAHMDRHAHGNQKDTHSQDWLYRPPNKKEVQQASNNDENNFSHCPTPNGGLPGGVYLSSELPEYVRSRVTDHVLNGKSCIS